MRLILHYTESVYQEKINELERLMNKLQAHAERLEELKERVMAIWEDENAAKHIRNLNLQIRAVKNASHRTRDLRDAYASCQDQIHKSQVEVGGIVETVKGALASLNISDD